MRKHDVRKWLHAILDLLPLVVIPVFMVYSHRHTIDSYSVTRDEPLEVNAFQYVKNGKPTSDLDNITVFDSDWEDINNDCYVSNSYLYVPTDSDERYLHFSTDEITFDTSDIVYVSSIMYADEEVNFALSIGDEDYFVGNATLETVSSKYSYTFTIPNDLVNYYIGLNIDSGSNDFYIKDVMYFNLTSIFGSGNEPTLEVFESYLSQDYYSYGNNILFAGTHSVTYDKTDIGNQMFYSLYNTVEQQFNFTKVFNFGDLYNFLNLNLFGGNSPLSIFVIYNIIIYEFLMDMLFIIYSVLMFLIDFVEDMFDKVFTRSKHGGN